MEQLEDSTNHVYSNERFHQDEIKLLNILPAEMWCEIFARIDDPEDKEMFINSSLFFRELFYSQRTEFLFQSVFGVLGKKFEENISIPGSVYRDRERPEVNSRRQVQGDDDLFDDQDLNENDSVDNDSDDDDSDEENEAETEHIVVLVKSLVQRLGGVCKSWNKGVAHFYQNHYRHYQRQDWMLPSELVEDATDSIIQDEFSEWDLDHAYQFLDHFGATHEGSANRNPFFGKGIEFDFPVGESDRATLYANTMLNILAKYGHHVWHCGITFTHTTHDKPEECYPALCALLELMPNLKSLRLNLWLQCSVLYNGEIKPSLLKQFEEEIRTRPLPTLKHLQLLSAHHVCTPIYQELVRRYHHVSTLDISELKKEKKKEFQISQISYDRDFELLISNLRLPQDPIYWDDTWDIEWDYPRNELRRYFPVAMETEQKIRIYQESQAIHLNFSDLKIWVMAKRNLCALDFLLSLNNPLVLVEIINIVDDDILSDAEKGKTIQLSSSADCPLGCNIWSLFPKLIRVFVQQFMETGRPINLAPHQSKSPAMHFENSEDIKKSLSTFCKHVFKVKNNPGVTSWVRINIK